MSEVLIPVSSDWQSRARIDRRRYEELYARSVSDPEGFWGEVAGRLDWIKPFTKVMNVSFRPDDLHIRWFEDGTLNVAA
ncbi:MAG: acetyl-coenzyme A synthetase, partial [Alphaproteobacteria bacterium]|nr:acetyl-coenzyme A synthetase [Alphaproteobacteria bacterium]